MRPYYYLGGRRGLTQLSTGQMFIVNTDARDIATWIIHAGVWETFVDDILCALARPGDTFLDVGSNMGYYAIKIGGLIGPKGRLYAYEPNPDLFEALYDNVQINGFGPRAQVFQACAGDEAGTTTLTFERRFPGGGTAGLGPEYAVGGREQAHVQVVRIDDTIPEGTADLVKIDVEGFEPLVLKGMTELLKRSPNCAMVLEVSYGQWERYGDPVQLLRDAAGDRRIFRIRRDGKIEELPAGEIDQSLNRQFPSYLLLLPDTPARYEQVKRYVASEHLPVDLHGEEKAPPPPGLLKRIKARLDRI